MDNLRRLDNLLRFGTVAEVDHTNAKARVTAGGITEGGVIYQDATPEQLPLGSFVGISNKAGLDGSSRNGWVMINKGWSDRSGAYAMNRIGIVGNRLYLQSALDYQRWGEVAEVVTDKNDILIKGTKTFDYQLRIKSAEQNVEKYARLGQNVYDTFLQNPYSLKYLQLKNNGKLQYDNKDVFVKGLQNPSWEDIENNPFTIAQPDRTVDVRSLTKDGIYAFNNASPNLPSAYAYKVLNLAGGIASWRHQLAFKAYSKEIYISSQKSSGSDEWLPWERLAVNSQAEMDGINASIHCGGEVWEEGGELQFSGAQPTAYHLFDRDERRWRLPNEAERAAERQAYLDYLKNAKLSEINDKAQAFVNQLAELDKTPDFERATWQEQANEAVAWHADPATPTPTLDTIAKHRNVPVEVLRQKAYEKTMAFRHITNTLAGKRQKLEDSLKQATTVEEIEAIEVVYRLEAVND